ncbi:MAG TPA: VWA domain-containing protein [Gemmatimonadales bacterium]|jgi:Ca-activated chloride channel family protein
MIGFARPWLLLLVLVLPWWWWRRRRQETVAAVVSDTSPFAVATRGRWRLLVPPALRSLTLVAFLVAAAGPFRPGDRVVVSANGIAIVIAIDVSTSMMAEDLGLSSRIEVAKAEAIAFVRGRTADRIGLVTFAGEALTQVPVTLDYAALIEGIRNVDIGALEDGTAIGSGLAIAVARLRKVPGASKVIVLLTDGVNNRGVIDPRTAAETAAAFGIKVYTVGVGSQGEARVPTRRDAAGGYHYENMPVEIDEALLQDIAQRTGGQYFRARDSRALADIFHQVDQLARAPVDAVRYTRQQERTLPLLAAGLLLLAVELVVSAQAVVRVP